MRILSDSGNKMSLKILVIVFLASGYVILSAWALDVQNKVDSANDRDNGILDKRDLKSDATLAKFLDPPPEYYRLVLPWIVFIQFQRTIRCGD